MSVFIDILRWLGDQIVYILSFIFDLLPDSPFQLLDYTPIADIIHYINYFVPLDFMLSVLTAWGTCIVLYYGYSIVLRWLKAIV